MKTTKPNTQRKKLFLATAHLRRKHFSAPLSPDLKEKHNANAFPIRMGDTVRVTRGDRRGFEGRITRVDRKNFRIYVEGVTRDKVDGTTIQIPIHPSKAMIVNLNLDDKWRREALKRKTSPLPKRFRNETTTKTGPEAVEEAGKEPAAKKPRRRSKGTREATVSSQKTRRRATKTTKKDESRQKKAKTARPKKEAE